MSPLRRKEAPVEEPPVRAPRTRRAAAKKPALEPEKSAAEEPKPEEPKAKGAETPTGPSKDVTFTLAETPQGAFYFIGFIVLCLILGRAHVDDWVLVFSALV